MAHHFFAYMAHMKHIKRWSMRRNTHDENVQEHSLQVVMIAHALAVIAEEKFSKKPDMEKVLLTAAYHEAPEVITGDLATPIKYFNPRIRDAFKNIERIAGEKLITYLPDYMVKHFESIIFPDEESYEWRLVKAADRISAYAKCLEEEASGNREFSTAKETILRQINEMNMPEAEVFMAEFAPSFGFALDALN